MAEYRTKNCSKTCSFAEIWQISCGRIELRALGKVSVGEELTVAYVDYLNLSEDRKRILKQQYFFDCNCDHCTNKTNDDLKMSGAVVDGVKVGFHTACF